jgi:hypothetical protein
MTTQFRPQKAGREIPAIWFSLSMDLVVFKVRNSWLLSKTGKIQFAEEALHALKGAQLRVRSNPMRDRRSDVHFP